MGEPVVVFFDVGETLASPVLSAAGHIERLDVYPFVSEVLDRLRAASGAGRARVALGLISNTTGETAASMRRLLGDAGLLTPFDPDLLLFSSVEGLDKSQKAFFDLASDRAGVGGRRCVFVGEREAERTVAASAHFHVSPHPLHALHLVRKQFSVQ
jgi:FMN phosphatase YigB (HAD superfamily)